MINRVFSILGFIGFIGLVVLTLVYYDELPDKIPTHFGINGMPDHYGDKSAIWVLTGIGAAMYIGLKVLLMNLHRIKPVYTSYSDNQLNFYRQYTRRALQLSSILTVGLFTYINYTTIQIALGKKHGPDKLLIPLIILSSSIVVIYTLINARKLKKMD